jgi:hypothetical protein
VSTLAFSHFPSADAVSDEWARILCVGGDVLLTDVHPAVAANEATTFCSGGRSVTIERHVVSLATLEATFARRGIRVLSLEERLLDESTRHYFRGDPTGQVLDRIRGLPLVYAMHLRKGDPGSPARAVDGPSS